MKILSLFFPKVNYQFAQHWAMGIMSRVFIPAPNGVSFCQVSPKITYIFD